MLIAILIDMSGTGPQYGAASLLDLLGGAIIQQTYVKTRKSDLKLPTYDEAINMPSSPIYTGDPGGEAQSRV